MHVGSFPYLHTPSLWVIIPRSTGAFTMGDHSPLYWAMGSEGMAPYGSQLLQIAPNGLPWLSMAPYELLMTPFDFHGYLFFHVAMPLGFSSLSKGSQKFCRVLNTQKHCQLIE